MGAELTGAAAYVDHYCERIAPGLWGEPLNTISNIGFFVAAWGIWRLASRRAMGEARTAGASVRWHRSGAIQLLFALCLAVGIGSTLFHLTAQVWSRTLDVTLIVGFELVFFWCYLRAGVRLSPALAATALGVFALAVGYSLQFQELLNGSLQYVPMLAALGGCGVVHRTRHKALRMAAPSHRDDLLAAAGVFAVALAIRTLDEPICPEWPGGTHFAWHLLNGVVIYLSARALEGIET